MKYVHLNNALGAVETERGNRPATLSTVRGFLFGVVLSPEMITPADWIDAMIDQGFIDLERIVDPNPVFDDLVALYNEVNDARQRAVPRMPVGVRFRADPMANFGSDATVGQWSFGFLVAHAWLQEVWAKYVPEEALDLVSSILGRLMHFASLEAAAHAIAMSADDPAFIALTEEMRDLFPDTLAAVAQLSDVLVMGGPGGPDALA